ncbi:hypothetical protein B0H67DRAFT_560314 [Lasiosphaeris hirsuta]|uniref:RNA-binding protein n=1 Tax=Lasiosphaeris hirsuta TaxID=260670 RepID=A0AA40B957_9PEZI|nr:hypothetical protein B0H67DRAFT_560314 [Lasiosphaeris hirsuta]
MYEGYGSAPRDAASAGGYRRSPPRHADPRDGEYRRSRKGHQSPSRSLNYDDEDQNHYNNDAGGANYYNAPSALEPEDAFGGGGHRGGYPGSRGGSARDAGYDRSRRSARSPAGGRYIDDHRDGSHARQPYGPPGKAIILEDIPDDATERDILYGLDYITRDRHVSSDKVKVARLRYDHNGRRIAFVEFHRRADAESFIEAHHPEVSFPLEHSRGVDSELITCGISFNRARNELETAREPLRDDEEWDCTRCGAMNYPHRAVCFKCKSERLDNEGYGRDYGTSSGPFLTGETDECPQQLPSQYLVVRGLEGSVTEQVLANGIMKLFLDTSSEPTREAPVSTNKLKSTAPTSGTAGLGAKPGSLRRVFLMRDRRSDESWRYGFAEFATVEDAKAAAAKFRASARFTIASKPVMVAFIHTGVFVPAFDADPIPKLSFTPIYNPTLRLKYWDERAYPSVLVVSIDPALDGPSPDKQAVNDDVGGTGKGGKGTPGAKKAKKEKEQAAANKAIAMMPQMQMWAKKSAELHGVKQKLGVDTPSAEDKPEVVSPAAIQREELEDIQPDGPLNPNWTDRYLSYADWDRMACLLCDWEVPAQQVIDDHGYPQYQRKDILIDHEVRVHGHYKDTDTKEKAAAKLAALGKEPQSIIRRTPRLRSEIPPVYVSYADFDALRCHLCRRTFKHAQTIWRHEQESELHKRMLEDSKNKERAEAELREKGKAPHTMVPDSKTQQQQNRYRDRAQERRQAFRQPNKPSAQQAKGTAEKRKEPVAVAEEAPAKKSKGAGMLAKMGWTAGVGLGAEGAGRTEAIAAEAYAPGVGLGAEGGKLGDATDEAARKTRGNFSDFVEKTRDKARERYERLDK